MLLNVLKTDLKNIDFRFSVVHVTLGLVDEVFVLCKVVQESVVITLNSWNRR